MTWDWRSSELDRPVSTPSLSHMSLPIPLSPPHSSATPAISSPPQGGPHALRTCTGKYVAARTALVPGGGSSRARRHTRQRSRKGVGGGAGRWWWKRSRGAQGTPVAACGGPDEVALQGQEVPPGSIAAMASARIGGAGERRGCFGGKRRLWGRRRLVVGSAVRPTKRKRRDC
jgi:hypothetical protein